MLALLTALLLTQTDNPAADLARGRSLAAAGNAREAFALVSQVARAYPTWGLAQIELAELLVAEGTDDAAIEAALAAARNTAPENPRAWTLSGRHAERRDRPADAVGYYERAAQLRPDLVELRERLGIVLAHIGRNAEAVVHLKAWLAANPNDRGARANLADSLEAIGDLEAAEAELRALADSETTGTVYLRRIARFYERTGRPELAQEELKKLDAKRPGRKMRPLPPSKR